MLRLKLIEGIVNFRENILPKYAQHFRKLAAAQTPHALFIACSDSRVVPNLLTSSGPGDLFNIRNVGNLVPPATGDGLSSGDLSEAGAVEYAVLVLKVSDIIVCGHSECGAMKAILSADNVPVHAPNLKKWLSDAQTDADRLKYDGAVEPGLKPHDRISQINVLMQLEHLASYPIVRERVAAGTLHLHGWWFDVTAGRMLAFDSASNRFELIDRKMIKQMVKSPPGREPVHSA